jgi:hypothetical protein
VRSQRDLKAHLLCLGGLCGLVQLLVAEEALSMQDLEPTDRVCGQDRRERRPGAPDASLVSAGTDAPGELKPKFRPRAQEHGGLDRWNRHEA